MTLNYETAQNLVERGEFGELRKLAEPLLAHSTPFEPRVLVPVAHALVYTGDSRRALALLAQLDLESKKRIVNPSQARLVLGLAHRFAGSMTTALSQFQRALHLAQESGNREDAAWAHICLFRHMIDSHPVDLAPAMLPAVRGAVTRVGSSRALAYLHVCVAVLEGHNGRLREALRHCDRAASLLARSPNPWIACGNELNRTAILLAQCRFSEALPLLESMKRTATLHGLTHEANKADANLGRLLRMTGDFDRAIETLTRIVGAPSTSRLLAMNAWEEIAHIHLLRGDFDACDQLLARMESDAIEDAELANSYVLRWGALTRANLLLNTGRAQEALDYLARCSERTRGMTDAPVATGLSILRSQAFQLCGRLAEAAHELCRADQLGATSIREAQGRFYDAAGCLVEESDPALAAALTERAAEIWRRQGTGWMRNRATRAMCSTTATVSEAINRLASIFDLAYEPRLAVRESLRILESLGCAVRLRAISGPAQELIVAGNDIHVLPLGSADDGETLYLECPSVLDPGQGLVLHDVVRIIRAALCLEKFKTAEHERTAFWPANRESDDEDTLFLSPEMLELVETATRVAGTDVPVLITGETGTGKEVLARLIHGRSRRAKRTFLPFNCTTVPKEMMDSQLFGHRRGAFTGASDNFQGVIRSARGGTLLLDEIGDLGLELQPKLLRFLESGEVLPLGESGPVHADVRVIAATNANLDAAVSDGRFREDLYYRLNIVQLRIPPLRDRRIEIPLMARHFLGKYAAQFDKGELQLSDEAMDHLVVFSWPGNIRQLANEMRRLAALAEPEAILTPSSLSREIIGIRPAVRPRPVPLAEDRIVVRLDQAMPEAIETVERAMLQFAMERYEGRVDAVAKALGLSRKGLYLKRQRYQVAAPSNNALEPSG